MRVDRTTSDSGPAPRSHSPSRSVRASRFIVRPQGPDGVAQVRRLLILLGPNRRHEPCLQLNLQRATQPPAMPTRHLADVAHRIVLHALDERFEHGAKRLVVVRAAEPPLGLEVSVWGSAFGANRIAR